MVLWLLHARFNFNGLTFTRTAFSFMKPINQTVKLLQEHKFAQIVNRRVNTSLDETASVSQCVEYSTFISNSLLPFFLITREYIWNWYLAMACRSSCRLHASAPYAQNLFIFSIFYPFKFSLFMTCSFSYFYSTYTTTTDDYFKMTYFSDEQRQRV